MDTVTRQLKVHDVLKIALGHYHAGKLDHAELLCTKLLDQRPNHAGGTHLMGLIQHKLGKFGV